MKKTIYNKLVRDNIPSIIEAEGKKCTFHYALEEDHKRLIKDKLLEECNELIKAESPNDVIEEIADIYTVLHGIMDVYCLDHSMVATYAGLKSCVRGEFSSFAVLESVEEEEDEE